MKYIRFILSMYTSETTTINDENILSPTTSRHTLTSNFFFISRHKSKHEKFVNVLFILNLLRHESNNLNDQVLHTYSLYSNVKHKLLKRKTESSKYLFCNCWRRGWVKRSKWHLYLTILFFADYKNQFY